MACRQRHDLLAPAVEEGIGRNDQRLRRAPGRGLQCRVDLAFRAGLQDGEAAAHSHARGFLRVANDALRCHIGRVQQKGDHLDLRNQLGQQLEPLRV